MAYERQYHVSRGKGSYITFDSKGYIVQAKGFAELMWTPNFQVDKDLVGKHVDKLAEMLKRSSKSRNVYLEFEANVHVPLLKQMLADLSQ